MWRTKGIVIVLILAAAAVLAEDTTEMDREEQIRAGFAQVQDDYARLEADIRELIRVRLDLAPELLVPGEEVVLTIAARSVDPPNPVLEVIQDCFGGSPQTHRFRLDWRRDRAAHGFVTEWRWRPPGCGNYRLHWVCDVGGDIPEFWRSFSVVDETYAVVIINSTSHIDPRPEPDFHECRLPFSYWAESLLFAHRPTAEQFAGFSRGARQFGDDPGLMIFLAGDYVPGDKTVFYDEPESVQRTILECYKELWPMHGFPRPIRSLYTYGMGNGPVRVARSLGYDLLGALCADQNWGDGPFKINHWGMPARPYFVSDEDFRKPGDGGREAMVGIQQCARQSVLCRDYHCVYSFEPVVSYAFNQYLGLPQPPVVRDILQSREMDFFHCFLACAGQTETPYFLSCGFEFNGVWPLTAPLNRRFMEYLTRQAADGPIAFTTATAAADFFRRHHRRTPESVLYLHDVFAGLTHGGKPVNYPDTIEIENHAFKAIFRRGETLPYAQYDYTTRWDYPDWGNEDIPRKPDGYVVPNTDDRFRVTPSIVDTRSFQVSTRVEDTADGTRVTVDVVAANAQKNLALAVWDIPREYSARKRAFRVKGARRFVPVRAPYTDNLCGILVANVRPGENRIVLTVRTPPREPRSLDLALGESAMAKVFERDGTATAYLFASGESAETILVTPPEGVACTLYPSDAGEPLTIDQITAITIEPGQCQRLVGLTYDQMLRACPSATPAKEATRGNPGDSHP